MIKLMNKFMIAVSILLIGVISANAEPLKVGFVYLTNPGDHGWTYAHERARLILEDHLEKKLKLLMLKMFQKVLMQQELLEN